MTFYGEFVDRWVNSLFCLLFCFCFGFDRIVDGLVHAIGNSKANVRDDAEKVLSAILIQGGFIGLCTSLARGLKENAVLVSILHFISSCTCQLI
jgi:hypothetical protein